jgi:hypothetical protein
VASLDRKGFLEAACLQAVPVSASPHMARVIALGHQLSYIAQLILHPDNHKFEGDAVMSHSSIYPARAMAGTRRSE